MTEMHRSRVHCPNIQKSGIVAAIIILINADDAPNKLFYIDVTMVSCFFMAVQATEQFSVDCVACR